jgi:hypothetical protein
MLLNHPEVPIDAERVIASVDIPVEAVYGELDADVRPDATSFVKS